MTREIVIYGVTNELGAVGIPELLQICIQFFEKFFADHGCDHDLTF